MDLQTPIDSLPRTSSRTIQKLKKLEITTYDDLLHYYPFRYDDYSTVSTIHKVQPGETVTIKGTIEKMENVYTKRGYKLQKALLVDSTGPIELVWYNQQYLAKLLTPGTLVSVAGAIEQFGNRINMKPMEYEVLRSLNDPTSHTGRLVPVYSQIFGLSSKTIREKIQYLLQLLERVPAEHLEFLPTQLIHDYELLDQKQALMQIHNPPTISDERAARRRLAFDELFIRIFSSHLVKKRWEQEQITTPIHIDASVQKKIDAFIATLPFELTKAQQRSIDEILADINKQTPMNRFLQGDVGSGKTVVAAVAAYATHLNKLQTLIMAPTEILAQQHYKTISNLANHAKLKIALQTGSHKDISKGDTGAAYNIIVGTQALITQQLNFDRVGLVVIDEQHRFGVRQRAMLKDKGINPHLLTMTATPIPRTVSLTLYSELDLSVIDEMPKGRKEIKTYLTPAFKRDKGYQWIQNQIKTEGTQVYIICPLIEESESETMKSVRAATEEYEYLKKQVFTSCKVALLHGKMKAKEKEQVMNDFKAKKYDILISTSVVEVGVDVPNATIMVIEGAERFGIAQLHQLRGRVGRGDKQSYCFLFTSTSEGEQKKRLSYFCQTNSGLELAEYDLKLRGPGDLYGTQQHGYTDLKLAQITDTKAVHRAKAAVELFDGTYKLTDYPRLQYIIEAYQVHQISRD